MKRENEKSHAEARRARSLERPRKDRMMRGALKRARTEIVDADDDEEKAEVFATQRRPNSLSKTILPVVVLLVLALGSRAEVLRGNLTDISLAALNTKITFMPTNVMAISGTNVVAGGPRTIDSTNGFFSITLAQGQYNMCLPLITWRHCSLVRIGAGTNVVWLTNALSDGFIFADDGSTNGVALEADR